jgi:bud emergence protein 1
MMYDFVAERDDELSALKDEPVLIQAISTEDWCGAPCLWPCDARPSLLTARLLALPARFVAKKIVTVSKPGLIPVSFVEILDPATGLPHADVPRLLRESALPDVKEWREKTESYASSTIPLGRLDDGAPSQGVTNSPYAAHPSAQQPPQQQQRQSQQSRGSSEQYHGQHQRQPSAQPYAPAPVQHQHQQQHQRGPSSSHHHGQQPSLSRSIQSDLEEGMLPPGTFSSACVVSFHQEKVEGREEYFFRIHAVFLPDNPAEKASRLILFRTYDHFYRFQIDLLDTFPAEAGRINPANPSAPPPRRILPYMPGPLDEVDDAITHDRRSELDAYIRFLIALHRIRADYVLSSPLVRSFFYAGKSDGNSPIAREVAERELEAERNQEPLVDLEDSMDNLGLGGDGDNDHRASGGSHQRHHSRSASQQQQLQRGPSQTLSQSAGSSHGGGGHGRTASPLPPIDTNIRRAPHSASSNGLASQRPPSNDYASGGLPSAVSSSWGSNAGGNGVLGSGLSPMTPGPLTAGSTGSGSGGHHGGGPAAAYKKIKIYDSSTDDVMAIRVPPNVTFDQLSQKVQDRLGGGRRVLSFRDSVGSGKGANRGIEDDRDLLDWMSRTDKLVLCVAPSPGVLLGSPPLLYADPLLLLRYAD